MSETFGRRLARWREAAGLTQGEVARRVGVTPTYIGHLEREADQTGGGTKLRPMIEVVDAIAAALDVPLAEVRCAAGYDPPEDSHASCELMRSTFGEGDFAALHRMYERLTPERRMRFQPLLEMVSRELEIMLSEQGDQHPDVQHGERGGRLDSGRHIPRRPSRPRAGFAEPTLQHDRRRKT
ncbi:MAG: helix-turn-helix domain-containing protein [Acidobacteria bacterium]|nr:helix-turn-helix domain-containing protein [Acidobacteriota bacterium]MCA1618631.1 helix-turn-helix domain-containing protein [Acidobacteriota bacterium]